MTTLETTNWNEIEASAVAIDSSAPIHKQVTQRLQQMLGKGVWQTGDQIPGERELAEYFGISVLTLNKAVSALVQQGLLERQRGRGTFVSLPKRVETRCLAVVMHSSLKDVMTPSDYYTESLVHGIQAALAPHGFDYSLSFLGEWHPNVLAAMPRTKLSGVLMMAPPSNRWNDIERLWELGLPVVVLGASWPDSKVPTVGSDNRGGTHEALRHLLQLGHRKIGFIYPSLLWSDHRNRLNAYHDFMSSHNLPVNPEWVVESQLDDAENDVAVLKKLLESPNRPTAIFAGNYYSGALLLHLCQQMGISVPDDLSVVAFDDPFSASLLTPPLSTVTQPLREMGAAAMKHLLTLVEGQPFNHPLTTFPSRLMLRQSTTVPNTVHSISPPSFSPAKNGAVV